MNGSATYPWGDSRRYFSYAAYFRSLFGARVQKLSVDAGFTCPNRDGSKSTGGCTFCRNDAFTPSYCVPSKSITQQIDEGIEFHQFRYRKASRYLVYFQSYSNTYASVDRLEELYAEALGHKDVVGIVVGTRPDCVDERKLDLLASIAEKHYAAIEFGIESMFNGTLEAVNRCHTVEDAEKAVRMASERRLNVGGHFILGLPGESKEMILSSIDRINAMPLSSIKFHQLQIFRGTKMAEAYQADPDVFRFFELDEYIDLVVDIMERLRPDLVVERFASEAPPRYHFAGGWGLIRNEQLWAMLEKRLEERDTFQGKKFIFLPSNFK